MMNTSDETSYIQTVLLQIAESKHKRAEVHRRVDMFFNSLDRITVEQANWELDLLQESVHRLMTQARKE